MESKRRDFLPVLCLLLILAAGSAALGQDTGESGGPKFTRSEPLGPEITARPGADEVLDLEACVLQALETNDALKAERLRMAELEGVMDQALSTGLPTLDLVGDWSRGRDPSFALDSTFGGGGDGGLGAPPDAPDWFNDWLGGFGSFIPEAGDIKAQSFLRANANLNWTINPLKISGAVGAAKLGIRRQELNTTAVENQTSETTVAAYYSIIKAAERISAVRAQLANQKEVLDIIQMRYELGLTTRLDTLQAAVTLANTRPQLTLAQARLRNEGARLNAIMGRRPEDGLRIANRQEVETDPIQDHVALELAQTRPELESSLVFADILRKNKKAQQADNRPYLTLFGSYGYVGNTFDNVFEDGHDTWRTSVALNVPVFDGLLTRGLVAETEAQIRRTEAEVTGQRRLVQVETLELLANLRSARELLLAVQLNLARSEEVLEESLLMLQMGKVNFLDVLLSEANRAEARSNVIDARYEVLVITASLKRALGYSPLVSLNQIPGLVAEVSP